MQTCMVCNEEITNPICNGCLEYELMYWARDRDKNLISKIKKLKKEFNVYETTDATCIRCGSKINICSHCFLIEVMDLIKDEDLKSLFKKSFISF
ncbi:MAG: hypothetical protein PHF86_06860 [Candidatus Nanoarchaeia archaeon]|nr:hypothetical protein [Candidatus Nanoarchaeia archaeon]